MALKKSQKSLKDWTKQKWRTKSGKPSAKTGERYLPTAAIKSLSASEYAATSRAKRKGTKAGKQFVAQPKKIAKKTARFRRTQPMNVDPIAVPIPIPQDKVITDWPVKNKQQRVEETAKAIDKKSDKYRYETVYTYHPHNGNKVNPNQGHNIDFVVAQERSMASTIIDDYKIFPRLMMLVVTILTYQSVHWYMSLPDPTNGQAGLVSVCMGALTGCFGIWMNKEAKTDRGNK